MSRIATVFLYIFVFMPISFTALAQQENLSIDSFRVLNTTPDFVDIEIVGSNEGSRELLWLGVIAKSRDGIVRTTDIQSAIAPTGKQFRILSRALRPYGLAEQKTDILMVKVYPGSKDIIRRHNFEWHHVWPEKAANPAYAVEEFADLSTGKPWQIFYENLAEEEFAALDIVIEKWNNPKERDKNGEWKLDSFRNVFVNYATQKRNWKRDLKRIKKWRDFNPKSAGAAIAESKYWVAYAWNIRGLDNQTDSVALRVFDERLLHAEQILKDAKDYSAENPLWYEAYLDVAVTLRRDYEFIETLYKEAIQRHPYFQPLYLNMSKYWAPRAGGGQVDWSKADEVIRQAAENSAKIDGVGNYAMLYVQLGKMQKSESTLFEDSHVSWDMMRDSFEERVKRYPSLENLNEFAAFACRANDKQTFLNIRPRIINRIFPRMWLNAYSYDLCDHRFMQKI